MVHCGSGEARNFSSMARFRSVLSPPFHSGSCLERIGLALPEDWAMCWLLKPMAAFGHGVITTAGLWVRGGFRARTLWLHRLLSPHALAPKQIGEGSLPESVITWL